MPTQLGGRRSVATRQGYADAQTVPVEAAVAEALVCAVARALVCRLGLGAGQLAAGRTLALLEHLARTAGREGRATAAATSREGQDEGDFQGLQHQDCDPQGPHDSSRFDRGVSSTQAGPGVSSAPTPYSVCSAFRRSSARTHRILFLSLYFYTASVRKQ